MRTPIALLVTLLLACAGVVAVPGTAQAADPDSSSPATWNMDQSRSRWSAAYDLARAHDVVALQEVPATPPTGARYQGSTNGIDHYLWQEGPRGPERHLYILETPSRNLGMVTSWEPDEVLNIPGAYRPALAVTNRSNDILFASVHAQSRGGNDGGSLVQRIDIAARAAAIGNWAALGDFNRHPSSLPGLGLPGSARIYNAGEPTYIRGSDAEYDYLVSNVDTDRWRATVESNAGSDHWPVHFGALEGAAGPRSFTMHVESSEQLLSVSLGRPENGTHIVQYSDDQGQGARSRWFTEDAGTSSFGEPLVRLRSAASQGRCLDVHNREFSRVGDYLQLWDCNADLPPDEDEQTYVLQNLDPRYPNRTVLLNYDSGYYAALERRTNQQGVWAVLDYLTPAGQPRDTEAFYLHPTV
ncbi:hypothetical protein [Streptomyces sp. NPDC059850]|uniref:hypothetical protein n=1 Tax=Streptomyces sp. NPDC059850 TaxID=3346970 RepID=UPI0036680E53